MLKNTAASSDTSAPIYNGFDRAKNLLTAAPVPVLGGTSFPLNPIATF